MPSGSGSIELDREFVWIRRMILPSRHVGCIASGRVNTVGRIDADQDRGEKLHPRGTDPPDLARLAEQDAPVSIGQDIADFSV